LIIRTSNDRLSTICGDKTPESIAIKENHRPNDQFSRKYEIVFAILASHQPAKDGLGYNSINMWDDKNQKQKMNINTKKGPAGYPADPIPCTSYSL
ncbi:MAG: hypothetical protein FWF95_05310, partial [Syntrophorhabdaceae bacterium]|nr:hypothetical protein [Syntrophorhabdaceae bacterium]